MGVHVEDRSQRISKSNHEPFLVFCALLEGSILSAPHYIDHFKGLSYIAIANKHVLKAILVCRHAYLLVLESYAIVCALFIPLTLWIMPSKAVKIGQVRFSMHILVVLFSL